MKKNIYEIKRPLLKDNLEDELRKIVDLFFEKTKRKITKKIKLGEMLITIEDGTQGRVNVFIDPYLSKEFKTPVYAYLDTEGEENNPNKLFVSLNPNMFVDKTELYNTLYHEFLHATDPVFSTKSTEKFWRGYDSEVDEKYWGHQVEFRAITGEILNALVKEFIRRKESLIDSSQLKYLIDSNENILHHFSQGEELTKLSKMIFQSMFKVQNVKSILSDIVLNYPSTSDIIPFADRDMNYLTKYLSNIKKFGGQRWNKFLSMLYTTHNEIMEILLKK